MRFTEHKEPPVEDWCLVKVPDYSPSGFAVAQWNGEDWVDDCDNEVITEYVKGWCLIESNGK